MCGRIKMWKSASTESKWLRQKHREQRKINDHVRRRLERSRNTKRIKEQTEKEKEGGWSSGSLHLQTSSNNNKNSADRPFLFVQTFGVGSAVWGDAGQEVCPKENSSVLLRNLRPPSQWILSLSDTTCVVLPAWSAPTSTPSNSTLFKSVPLT